MILQPFIWMIMGILMAVVLYYANKFIQPPPKHVFSMLVIPVIDRTVECHELVAREVHNVGGSSQIFPFENGRTYAVFTCTVEKMQQLKSTLLMNEHVQQAFETDFTE